MRNTASVGTKTTRGTSWTLTWMRLRRIPVQGFTRSPWSSPSSTCSRCTVHLVRDKSISSIPSQTGAATTATTLLWIVLHLTRQQVVGQEIGLVVVGVVTQDNVVVTLLNVLVVITLHSGFGPSDWPIWTDFAGGKFRQRALFFGKSYRENKNCSGSENTPKKL